MAGLYPEFCGIVNLYPEVCDPYSAYSSDPCATIELDSCGNPIGSCHLNECEYPNLLYISDLVTSLQCELDELRSMLGGSGAGAVGPAGPAGPAGLGSAVIVEDEGIELTPSVSKINFVGAGVIATEPLPDEIEVSIPGGGNPDRIIAVTFDGGGSVITAGSVEYVYLPFAGNITQVVLVADVIGSVVIDIWNDLFTSGLPTVADTITNGTKPEIIVGTTYEDSVLAGWTVGVAPGDLLGFHIDSSSTIKKLNVFVYVTAI